MSLENPNPVLSPESPRPPLTTQTYHSPAGVHPGVIVRNAGTITTSTYQSPPWSWMARASSSDQLIPLAALAVILAALVAIVGILALIAILVARSV
jgi:hypothetical protein